MGYSVPDEQVSSIYVQLFWIRNLVLFFAGFMVVATVWSYFLLPETKDLTVDQMDMILYVHLLVPLLHLLLTLTVVITNPDTAAFPTPVLPRRNWQHRMPMPLINQVRPSTLRLYKVTQRCAFVLCPPTLIFELLEWLWAVSNGCEARLSRYDRLHVDVAH